ncbi:MAG: Crp/Fnr family transcriptional regulator [Butyricicoccus sp.]|nr:Crp/Fnr family transcriptional regulator [Butyricicoccus sp.]
MPLEQFFPVWDQLTPAQQQRLREAASLRQVPKGTVLHNGSADCVGLLVIRSGRLRAFMRSDEGKEVTLYRLFERDICLFSASCMLSSLQFDVVIEAETDSEMWVIPAGLYQQIMQESAVVANYTNELMATRLSEIMWRMDQILFKRFDSRLADFLLEESQIEQSDTLSITHEKIAAHMGTAREVVTRMLKYFQSEGMVRLARGVVELTDRKRLRDLAE